jgi:RHS repeat-associated protein
MSGLFDFVLDSAARPVLAAITAVPNPVAGGTPAFLRLTLSAPAPSLPSGGGATVSLVFSNPAATSAYDSAMVPAGALVSDFSVTTKTVSTPQTTTITAFYGGVQQAVTLNVIPATCVLASVALNPAAVIGGWPTSGTVTLNAPAPTGGVVVNLTSNDATATVPASVTVLGGATTATFTVTTTAVAATHSVYIEGAYGYARGAWLTVNPAAAATLVGVAPGWALPGDATPVLYGLNIQPGSTVTFTGPVYTVTDTQNPLCTIGGTCPASVLAAIVDVNGAYAAFAIPAGASPGIYHLKVRSALGVDSSNNEWIVIDAPQKAFGAVPNHGYATRIYPGQTITGTLTGNFPINGISDYNFYYFVATAGTRLSVTMQRVDTSTPWENASSLDPQIEVIAPDGFIYSNLQGFDDVSGSNLNASITDAVLPQTGVYLIAAETTRGAGQYRLTFNPSRMAPAPAGSRVIMLSGSGATVPLGRAVSANALMLDPLGYPIAGADVTYAVEPNPDDTGALVFIGGSATQTSLQGVAVKGAQITTAGKVRFRPSFTSPVLSNARFAPPVEYSSTALAASGEELIVPLYRPAARRPFSILGIGPERIVISERALTRLAPELVAARHEYVGSEPASAVRSPLMKAAAGSTGGLSPTPKTEPRALPQPMAYARVPLAITGCAADLSLFVEFGVNVPEVYPPLTVTLTDMTPPIGGGAGNRVIDFQGIRDHRIEKTVRIKVDIKDGHGATPNYPVLVELAVGGPRHGSLILDPDGAQVTCSEASFVWHDVGPGPNDQFAYKLGTLSLFGGVAEDESGTYRPVWDEAETLGTQVSTIDSAGDELQFENSWAARPDPGKPDHFACRQPDGSACPDTFRFWSGYLAYGQGTSLATPPYIIYDSYELDDKYDNRTYGYSGASMTAPASNVTAQFFDEIPGVPYQLYGVDLGQYAISSSWTNSPAWPNGSLPSTLRVDYGSDPDGDWPSGAVTKDITYQFEDTNSHALIQLLRYDLIKPDGTKGVTDGTFPMVVKPGMLAANMPKTEVGDTRRLTLLTVSGLVTRPDYFTTNSGVRTWHYAEPYSAGTRFWSPSSDGFVPFGSVGDPKLEVADTPAFRFTLIDSERKAVTDGASFRVYSCPRFDHESQNRSCSSSPVDSVGGVVDNFSVNGMGDTRGYVGFELTKAPVATGEYFIKAESLGQNYRVRRQGDFVASWDTSTGEWIGAFSIAVVDDPVPNCACETCNEQCTASPNFIATGTYQARAVDLTLPTSGFPVQVSRRYLSSNRKSGAFGVGWTTSLESRIWFSSYIAGPGFSAQAANILLPDGAQFRFTINAATGAFVPPLGRRDQLVRNDDGTFNFTVQRSRTVYVFDSKGWLTSMTDEFGNAVTVTYGAAGQAQRIADQGGSGRYIDVSWRSDGRVDFVQDSAGRRVSYGYGSDGTLTSATDPASRVTHYRYKAGSFGPLLDQISDNWNRALTVVTYDAGDRTSSYTENLETYTYAYADGITTKTDSSGHTSTFTTAPSGQITNRTPPPAEGSGTAHTDYNDDGSIAGTTDEMGVRTNYIYDAHGRVSTVTRDATGSSPVRFEYTYDPTFPDKVTTVTPKNPASGAFDPNWQGWRYDYFPTGTLNHVYRLRSDGTTTDAISTFGYDTKGRVTQQTTATGAVTDYVYTGADLSTVTQPSNGDSGTRPITTYSNYDGAGRPRTITDPAGKNTTYTYDALGRVLTVTLPSVSGLIFTTTYSYDNFDSATGLVFTNITDPNGKLTKLGYDEHGRLLKSIDALSNATTYGYTRDLLTSITDANDNATGYHYDPLRRLDKTTFPDGKLETYAYYSDGLLGAKTDRMGQTIMYEYDAFKRLKKKTYPDSAKTITYTYQGQKLAQVDDTSVTPSETHTFSYDSSYRVQQNVQGPRGTLSYTYTPDDRVDIMTIAGTPAVTTGYTYYADGSLNTIAWSLQAGVFKYAYTPRGQYQTVTFPNGQARGYTYDDQGRLTQLSNTLSATNIATYAYGYDTDWATGLPTMLGQRVSMTADVPSQGFANAQTKYSYDPLYQLVKAQYPATAPFNAEVDQWTYDAIGNRLTNQVNTAIQTYTYEQIGVNPKNAQKLLGDGTNTYTYDFNGSQSTRLGPSNYGFLYDPDNRLASINGNETANYTYDYQGRRTSKTVGATTTKYLYDGSNLVRESVATANTDYVFGPSIDEPLAVYASGAISYLNADGLGSVAATNSTAGTVSHSSVFDAWGTVKSETGTRIQSFTYTGREVGEAGLLFYRARSYQPLTERFSQEDPIRAWPSPYVYTRNAPTMFSDPEGLMRYRFKARLIADPARWALWHPGQAMGSNLSIDWDCHCEGSSWKLEFIIAKEYLAYFPPKDSGGYFGTRAHELRHIHQDEQNIEDYTWSFLGPYEKLTYGSEQDCLAKAKQGKEAFISNWFSFDWRRGQAAIDSYLQFLFD